MTVQASSSISSSEESISDFSIEVERRERQPAKAEKSRFLSEVVKRFNYTLNYVWERWSKPVMWGGGALVMLITTFAIWQQSIEPEPVDVVEVRQGMLSQSSRGSGRIVSRKQVDLTSATSGQVAVVAVEEGSRVTPCVRIVVARVENINDKTGGGKRLKCPVIQKSVSEPY